MHTLELENLTKRQANFLKFFFSTDKKRHSYFDYLDRDMVTSGACQIEVYRKTDKVICTYKNVAIEPLAKEQAKNIVQHVKEESILSELD